MNLPGYDSGRRGSKGPVDLSTVRIQSQIDRRRAFDFLIYPNETPRRSLEDPRQDAEGRKVQWTFRRFESGRKSIAAGS